MFESRIISAHGTRKTVFTFLLFGRCAGRLTVVMNNGRAATMECIVNVNQCESMWILRSFCSWNTHEAWEFGKCDNRLLRILSVHLEIACMAWSMHIVQSYIEIINVTLIMYSMLVVAGRQLLTDEAKQRAELLRSASASNFPTWRKDVRARLTISYTSAEEYCNYSITNDRS